MKKNLFLVSFALPFFLPTVRTAGLLGIGKNLRCKRNRRSRPTLKEMTIEGRHVKLTFNNAENGLTFYGKELINFYMVADNQHFYQAKAIITREGITLISRYAPSLWLYVMLLMLLMILL